MTYNGATVPEYITHYKEKSANLEVSDNQSDFMVKLVKHTEGKKSSTIKTKNIEEVKKTFNMDFISHNDEGVKNIEEVKKYYRQPFVPYVIKVEILLLYGDKLLNYESQQITHPVPWCNSPHFNTKIHFTNIKISKLPLETRLCFNVITYSGYGDKLIIGSGNLNLFNGAGEMLHDQVEISLWPFYKVGQRITCHTDYNGKIEVVEEEEVKSKYESDHLASQNGAIGIDSGEYSDSESFGSDEEDTRKRWFYTKKCTMTLKFQSFVKKVVYSLRDKNTMVILGHICRPPSFDETALPTEEDLIEIKELLKLNPLEIRFSDEVKKKILICRNYLKHIPGFLGIFLQAINWSEPEQIRTVLNILP